MAGVWAEREVEWVEQDWGLAPAGIAFALVVALRFLIKRGLLATT